MWQFKSRADALYRVYLPRQTERYCGHALLVVAIVLPTDIDYDHIGSLTAEARENLKAARPENLDIASRVPGVTPAALTALLRYVRGPSSHQQKPANMKTGRRILPA